MTEISDPKKITDVFVYLEKVSSYLLSSKKYEELESDFIAFVLEQLTFHFRRQTVLKARFHEMARSFLKRYSRDQIQLSGPVALKQFDVLMQTKLSVIVPVYNAESYLKQCLDSILTQTLAEIEIICVNDGSTDSSLSILNEYAAKDSRFKILTQRNQKQGAARNNALKIATGEFVQFVDADDYLCPDACECIYNRMKTDALDMLSFGGTNFLHETGELEPNKYYEFEYLPKSWDKTIFNYTDCIEFVQKMAVSAALTAYNLEFLKQNKIIFPEQLFFEDNVFFAKSIFTAKRVGIEKRTLYYRRVHSNSTTQNWNKNFLDYLKVIRLVMDVVSNKAIPSEVTEIYREAYLSSCVRIFNSFEKVDQDKYSITLSKLLSDFKFSKIKPVSSIKGWCLGQLPLIVWNHNAKDKYLKILGLVVFHKKKKNNTSTIRLFSIPVYSKKVTNCSITKKILFVKYVRMWKK